MNYKQDCIKHMLKHIMDQYKDMIEYVDDPDEKIRILKEEIMKLYSANKHSNDQDDAYYRCIIRRIGEALDLELDHLSPLLMEHGPCVKRLYYPQAGKK